MKKERLLALTDGVMAIIITIMVLELKVPHDATLGGLSPLAAVFTSYVLSFVNLAIFWNNHHHFFHLVERIDGVMLWANIHLLFWVSLVPFATGWMGENHFAPIPTAAYGLVLLMGMVASYGLLRATFRLQGSESILRQLIGRDLKGKASALLYVVGIPSAFVEPRISCAIYALVALMWFVPDRRIEAVARRL